MRLAGWTIAAALSLVVGFAGCATTGPPAVGKPGFYTEVREGRLWVLREGSKELEEFKKHGEPAHQVTRIGAGPRGMTIKSSSAEVIDAYLAGK